MSLGISVSTNINMPTSEGPTQQAQQGPSQKKPMMSTSPQQFPFHFYTKEHSPERNEYLQKAAENRNLFTRHALENIPHTGS